MSQNQSAVAACRKRVLGRLVSGSRRTDLQGRNLSAKQPNFPTIIAPRTSNDRLWLGSWSNLPQNRRTSQSSLICGNRKASGRWHSNTARIPLSSLAPRQLQAIPSIRINVSKYRWRSKKMPDRMEWKGFIDKKHRQSGGHQQTIRSLASCSIYSRSFGMSIPDEIQASSLLNLNGGDCSESFEPWSIILPVHQSYTNHLQLGDAHSSLVPLHYSTPFTQELWILFILLSPKHYYLSRCLQVS